MQNYETYLHYKGGLYIKLHEALHTETNEVLVIYVCAVRGEVFARPKSSFEEILSTPTYQGPRFKRVPSTDKEGAKEFLMKGCKL